MVTVLNSSPRRRGTFAALPALAALGVVAAIGGRSDAREPQNAPAASGSVVLRIASGFPKGFSAYDTIDAAARSILAKTEGRVRIELKSETTFGQNELPRLESGELDGAVVPSAMLAAKSPTAAVFALPLAIDTIEEAAFAASRIDPTIAAELKEHGWELAGRTSMGFAYLTSRPPIHSPKDLEGKRLWTSKQPVAEFDFGMTGATPTPLGFDEVEKALEAAAKGTPGASAVDCMIGLPDLAILKQWHRHLRFMLDLPLFLIDFRLVLRSSSLEPIAEADRELLRKELEAAFTRIDDDRRSRGSSFRRVFERAGFEIYAPPAEQRGPWNEWRDKLRAQFVKERAIPQSALDALEAAITEYRKTAGH